MKRLSQICGGFLALFGGIWLASAIASTTIVSQVQTITCGSGTFFTALASTGVFTCASTGLGTAAAAATGTSGHNLPYLDGTNTFSGAQTFGEVIGTVSTQSGTSYTLAATDCGTTVLFTSNSAITLTTLNSLPVGCAIAIEQG